MSKGGGLPSIDGMTSLKVDGFQPETRKDEVWDLFRKCGRIGDVYLPRDAGNGRGRGFAFVRFYEKKDAEMAIQDMDGKDFQGQRIRVNFAQVGRNTDAPPARSRREPSRRRRSRSASSRSRSRRGGRDRSRSRSRSRDKSPKRSRDKSPKGRRRRSPSRSSSASSRSGSRKRRR